ncbi:MAG: hypothetical protein JO256_04095, partial [Alphaproteobacteria bacterium]|nr:hypothetical protein [Alphaproteobacteria bacterium]
RISSPQNDKAIVVPLDKPDDIAALHSALEICRNQKIEVWDGGRQIGAVMLSGKPRLAL